MKINFKHVATAALAVAMSLSLASPALAEPVTTTESDGSLTVTGNELAGKNVFAVRMFTATVNKTTDSEGGEQTTSYARTDYELEEKWLSFFQKINYDEYNSNNDDDPDITTPVDAKDALAYMEWLKNDKHKQQWAEFAEDAQDWLYDQKFIKEKNAPEKGIEIDTNWTVLAYMEIADAVVDDEKQPVTPPTGKATFNNLPTGYYVVFPEGGSTGNESRGTDAMLINIPTGNKDATWNIKSTFPTVDKMVNDGNENTPAKDGADEGNADNGSAQVGDIVTFTLKSTVPDMSDYNKFYFAFHDTLTKGLELVTAAAGTFAETDVEVYIYDEGAEESADNAHKVPITAFEATFNTGNNELDVVFNNLKSVKVGQDPGNDIETGDTIVVKYRAKITEAAVSGSGSGSIVGNAQNDVYLEYSNNPSTEDHGTSTPDTSKVYTYQIGVHKYTGDWSSSAPCLPGAKFVLSKKDTLTGTSPNYEDDDGVIKLFKVSDNEYRVATADDVKTTYEFTTNDTGEIVIKGLEAGTYYLHEVAAPNGYNKLKEPIKITISVSGEDASLEAPVYTIGSTKNTASDDTVAVLNKQGIELPETGSIGTIGLTAAGVAIVLLGVFAPRKKKKSNQE